MSTRVRQPHRGVASWSARLLCIAVFAVLGLAACGSSKPAYCSARTNLENSIKGLTSLNVSSGLSGLQAQLSKIETDARTLVNQAKSDFPSETSAITSSVDALSTAAQGLAGNTSASQIGKVATSASSVVSSVNSFMSASKSKCS